MGRLDPPRFPWRATRTWRPVWRSKDRGAPRYNRAAGSATSLRPRFRRRMGTALGPSWRTQRQRTAVPYAGRAPRCLRPNTADARQRNCPMPN